MPSCGGLYSMSAIQIIQYVKDQAHSCAVGSRYLKSTVRTYSKYYVIDAVQRNATAKIIQK